MKEKKQVNTDRISSYFKQEWIPLAMITGSGILYNVGMVAGPYFEGQMVQKLFDIISGTAVVRDMLCLVLLYIAVILLVQGMRSVKRFYVRRFANNINRSMRKIIYNYLVFQKCNDNEQDKTGSIMTKVISDVDACVEGMRKFTTELFDTGVVLVAYIVMLFGYDWRLAAISCLFPPIAYIVAERLKKLIYRYNREYKKCTEKLSSMTLDRVGNEILYRLYGRENAENESYEKELAQYEKAAIRANVWENAMQPVYLVISSISVIFIIYYGAKNVAQTGWTSWNIAAFTTFLSCFTKMATKSSKAAKLFNSVQKAQVSWKRIKPYMKGENELDRNTKLNLDQNLEQNIEQNLAMQIEHLSFGYDQQKKLIDDLSLTARFGDMIGVTGPVASGKSTFGKMFLHEFQYEGAIFLQNTELSDLTDYERNSMVTYMGHQPELLSGSIEENICMGEEIDCWPWLKLVCMDQEVAQMPEGIMTQIGNGGVRLSGGQQARIALARTLCHGKKILILDDPISALDHNTELCIMQNLKEYAKDKVIILITHRLTCFAIMSKIIWLDQNVENDICDAETRSDTGQETREVQNTKKTQVATHEQMMASNASYRKLYQMQMGGDDQNA